MAYGARERPRLVPEELAFEDAIAQRGRVHRDEWLLRALAPRVQGSGREFLAGPALAGDEHGRWRVRDLMQHLCQLVRRRRTTDPPREIGVVGQGRVQVLVLPPELSVPQRPLDHHEELIEVHGFGEVVVRALLDGLDRPLNGGVRGDDDDPGHGRPLPKLGGKLKAVHARHVNVGDDDVGLPVVEHAQRLEGIRGGPYRHLGVTEQLGEARTSGGLVVDDKDLGLWSATVHSRPEWSGSVRVGGAAVETA